MRLDRIARFTLLAALVATTGCADVAGPDERWADPTQITYATALGVNLSSMVLSPTGLYWEDVLVGQGTAAGVGDDVAVHYTGWLPDGTVFDTSHDAEDEPIVFQLAEGLVIRGWDEGLLGMRTGGRRRLVIPPELAYGRRGNGPIPPLATIIFDVELVSVSR